MVSTSVNTIDVEDFLKHIWAFERLEAEQLHVLAELVRSRNLRKDEVLWLQGQKITFFSIVYSGQLRTLRRSSGGNEKLVSVLSPGQHFGLAEMITHADSAVTIMANQDSTILTIDQKSLQRELLSNAEICYRLMQTMARAIFTLTNEVEKTSFENVRTRLARLLMKETRPRAHAALQGKDPKVYEISHEQLAVQLGVSRETVSRILAEFKRLGLIDTAYRRITINDRDSLRNYLLHEEI